MASKAAHTPASNKSLTIVGTGIKAVSHLTTEARRAIEQADIVFYLVADPVSEEHVKHLNPNGYSLQVHYEDKKPRIQSYNEMIDRMLNGLREGKEVCGAFYGHPGVFVYPSHEAIRRARNEGYVAKMLPAISAEDVLYADLGFDPAKYGCMSYEATDFLIYDRIVDPRCYLILWQVGLVGKLDFKSWGYDNDRIGILKQKMMRHYSRNHRLMVYEAAQYVICEPRIEEIVLEDLEKIKLTAISTLVVPPEKRAQLNTRMAEELGLAVENG